MSRDSYVIRGGEVGRERLRLLSRILRPQTLRLFTESGLAPGMSCLDVGCGGGDASVEMARIVGPQGRVLGTDFDGQQLEIARREVAALGFGNITFEQRNALAPVTSETTYDFVFARMVLCHVAEPETLLDNMIGSARVGGLIVVEEIDFRGHFTSPACSEMDEYMSIMYRIMHRRGGNPDLGPDLPPMLKVHGLEDIDMRVAQVAAMTGESKLIHAVTMAAVTDVAIRDGLTTVEDAERITSALQRFAERDDTVMSLPRFIQVRGRKPG